MAHLKEQYICIKFCFKLGKTASEIYKMLKIAFADNAMGEHRLLNAFLNSNMGKLRLRIVSDQVTPPQVAQTKTWKKFTKPSMKTDEISLWRLLAC
jgi:hypothetical protein